MAFRSFLMTTTFLMGMGSSVAVLAAEDGLQTQDLTGKSVVVLPDKHVLLDFNSDGSQLGEGPLRAGKDGEVVLGTSGVQTETLFATTPPSSAFVPAVQQPHEISSQAEPAAVVPLPAAAGGPVAAPVDAGNAGKPEDPLRAAGKQLEQDVRVAGKAAEHLVRSTGKAVEQFGRAIGKAFRS